MSKTTSDPKNDPQKSQDRPWHHLSDGRFRNPKGSPKKSLPLRVALPYFAQMFGRSFNKVNVPTSHVVDREQAVRDVRKHMNAAGDFITWLGHASFLCRIAGKIILTDPYLPSYGGPAGFGPRRYVRSGIAIRDLPPIDVLVVSHNHYDHLDERALAQLPDKNHTTVLVPLKLGDFFRKRGFAHRSEERRVGKESRSRWSSYQ